MRYLVLLGLLGAALLVLRCYRVAGLPAAPAPPTPARQAPPPTAWVPTVTAPAARTGNLLRNAAFQDDWLSLLLETKNHHWCYASEFYNRRDENPDGWTCRGSWLW